MDRRLNILVVYADTFTGSRVMEIYQHLHQRLGAEFEFHLTWWRFDHLAHPQISEAAATAAKDADVIVFTVKSGDDLAEPVKKWIERWTPAKGGQNRFLFALVELGGEDVAENTPALTYLREVAEQYGIDYLPYRTKNFSNFIHPSFEVVRQRTADAVNPVDLIAQSSAPVPRWGLNE